MHNPEESLIRPLVRPFLYMLAFYVIVQAASDGALFILIRLIGPAPLGIIGGSGLSLISFFFQIMLGLLFIRWMGDGPRNHGFTLQSTQLYIFPAINLGIGVALLRTAISLPSSILAHSGIHHYQFIAIDSAIINGLYGAVNAFLFCGVMQEFISRRDGGYVRILRLDVPLAGMAVSLIAILFPVIQSIILFLRNGYVSGLAGVFISGEMVLVYSYWYDRSRSLAAPVIAGALSGILSGVLYYMAASGQFFHNMR